jgi:hypothetical protein
VPPSQRFDSSPAGSQRCRNASPRATSKLPDPRQTRKGGPPPSATPDFHLSSRAKSRDLAFSSAYADVHSAGCPTSRPLRRGLLRSPFAASWISGRARLPMPPNQRFDSGPAESQRCRNASPRATSKLPDPRQTRKGRPPPSATPDFHLSSRAKSRDLAFSSARADAQSATHQPGRGLQDGAPRRYVHQHSAIHDSEPWEDG